MRTIIICIYILIVYNNANHSYLYYDLDKNYSSLKKFTKHNITINILIKNDFTRRKKNSS